MSRNSDNEVKHFNRVVRRTSCRRELHGVVQRCRDANHRGWFMSLEQRQEDAGGGSPTSTPSHVSTTQLRIAQVSVWCFSFSFSVPGSVPPEENYFGNPECDSIPSWVSVASSESVVTRIFPIWKSAPRVELFGWEPPLVKNLKRMWINRATAGAVSVPLHHAGCWDCSG